jgi:hypothetical protein
MSSVRWFLGSGCSRRALLASLALALALAFTTEAAFACRGKRNWSRGDDITKLRPNEIVVSAQLVESYKDKEKFEYAIMGITYGFIYYLHVRDVIGGASGTDAEQERLRGANVYVRLNPSVCEAYFPRDFAKGTERTLVLRMGTAGLFYLVGGQG